MPKEKLAILGGDPISKNDSSPYYNSIGTEEKNAVIKVMEGKILSDFIGQDCDKFLGGRYVKKFEKMMCDYFKVKYAISFNSASTALQAAVTALGIGPGDEVITSPYTMTATASAILLNNAIPVFADLDPTTYSLDYKSIEKNITSKTKAIMLVNIFGGSSDFDKILPLAHKYKLKIIEDNAQAIGAKYKNKFLGTVGDIGIFSFNVHKPLQCGEGGVITTNDKRLALRSQLTRNHGEVVIDDIYKTKKNYEPIIGNNFRLSELHAAIAAEQLTKISKITKPKVVLANYLTSKLKKYNWLEPLKLLKKTTHVYYIYPFRFLKNKIGIRRSTFAKAMGKEGFPIHEGYTKPLYLNSIYQNKKIYPKSQFPFMSKEYPHNISYKKGICPATEKLYEEELLYTTICNLPRTKKDIDLFIKAIDKINNQAKDLKRYEKRKASKK